LIEVLGWGFQWVWKGSRRTLKTEQSNQKYEEQATEGNKKLIVELFKEMGKTINFK